MCWTASNALVVCVSISIWLDDAYIPEPPLQERRTVQLVLNTEYPLLQRKLLMPLRMKEEFNVVAGHLSYSPRDTVNARVQIENKDQAARLARDWIRSHFGPPAENTSLELLSCVALEDDNGKLVNPPQFAVLFQQRYKGILTEGGVSVNVSEAFGIRATLQLYAFSPMEKSNVTIISQREATQRLSQHLREHKVSEEEISRLLKSYEAHLYYSSVPTIGERVSSDTRVVVPAWAFGVVPTWLVEAKTGKVYSND